MLALVSPARISANPDAPLSIYHSEYVNATIEVDGEHARCVSWNLTGNLTVANLASETVSDVWIPILLNDSLSYDWELVEAPTGVGVNSTINDPDLIGPGNSPIQSVPQDVVDKQSVPAGFHAEYVHITELRPGERVVVRYFVTSGLPDCPPISVVEDYEPYKIVDGQPSEVNLTIMVTNGMPFEADFRIRKVLPPDNGDEGWLDQPGNPVFTEPGSVEGNGASGLSPDGKELYWTGDGAWSDWSNNFTISPGRTANLTDSVVSGTPDLSEVGGTTQKITLGTLFVWFRGFETLSGTAVGYVFSIGDRFEVGVRKERVSGSTWREAAVFNSTTGVFTYEIYREEINATEGLDPSTDLIPGSRKWASESENSTILPVSISPGGSHTFGPYEFGYGGVPKVWGRFGFRIAKDETSGWQAYNVTENGAGADSRFAVIEKIWVVSGYLIKARKEVRSRTGGEFCILVEMENLGDSTSPYVEFYDLVPEGFSAEEGTMTFRPYEMLSEDAGGGGPVPPDFSLKTSPGSYSAGYVWRAYPVPAPARGFAQWYSSLSELRSVDVRYSDGSAGSWDVAPTDVDTIQITFENGTTVSVDEGEEFRVNVGMPSETTFNVTWVQDSIATEGGYVVVAAKGFYENMQADVYNPVVVWYCVQGSGDYRSSGLFVVGVDPRNTMEATAVFSPAFSVSLSPAPTVEVAMAGSSILLALLAVARRRGRR